MHYIFAYAPIDVATCILQIDHDRKIFEIWFIGETQNHRCRQSVWLQHWNLYTAIFMLKVLSFPHVSKKKLLRYMCNSLRDAHIQFMERFPI